MKKGWIDMTHKFCMQCIGQGFCPKISVRFVSEQQVKDSDYIRDLKAFARRLEISDCAWHEYLTDLYKDYPGWVIGPSGREVFLNMEEFERQGIREWFRDFLRPCPDTVQPRVRREAVERVRILATILSAHCPVQSALWGVRPANDNRPPNQS